MKRHVYLLAMAALLAVGCGEGNPTAPTPIPVVPACERENTGTLRIRNGGFGGAYTVDVGFNGLRIATLRPGEEVTLTVTAGITYPLRLVLTNTTRVLWSGQTPIVNRCATQGVNYGG